MTTLPKISVKQPTVTTTSHDDPPVSSTVDFNHVGYEIDPRNRKERRKAGSSKRHRRGGDAPQKGIHNVFRGY